MAWTKAKTAIAVGASVLLAAGTITVTVKENQDHRTYPWQVRLYDSKVLDQASPQVRIIPAKYPLASGGWGIRHNKVMGLGEPLKIVIQAAYAVTLGTKHLARITSLLPLPEERYDFIASLPDGNAKAIQEEIRRKFGVVAKLETIETDVLLLRVKVPNTPGLRRSASRTENATWKTGRWYNVEGCSLSVLSFVLEGDLGVPVLDQTGLEGNYDFELKWNGDAPHSNPDAFKQALTDQLGLELVPSREPIEMLVVEKAKN